MPDSSHQVLGQLGHAKNPAYVQVKEDKWTKLSVVAAILALIVSFTTLLVTFSPWGNVHAIEPSSYAIIRQDTLGSPRYTATTEHLVLPLEWKNDRGTSVLIRELALKVNETDGDNRKHSFYLVKEYPQLSGPAFEDDYTFRNSLTLEPHSVSSRVLSFRYDGKKFRFKPWTEYEARITFLKNKNGTIEERPWPDEQKWQFCTYDASTAEMIPTGDVKWNWWLFEEKRDGSCQETERRL